MINHSVTHRGTKNAFAFFSSYGLWHWGEGFQTVLFTWYLAFFLDLPAYQVGFYQSLVLFPYLIFTLIGGIITDRVGAFLSFSWSTAIFALTLFLFGSSENLAQEVPVALLSYCIIAGLVSAISNPAIDTFIPEATPSGAQANAIKAATVHNIGKLLGTVTALGLAWLSAKGGFWVNGLLMIGSVLCLRFMRVPAKVVRVKSTSRDNPFKRAHVYFKENRESLDILISTAMLGLIFIPATYIIWPLTLRERTPEYGDMIAATNIVGWVGGILAASLVNKYAKFIKRPGRLAVLVWSFSIVILLSFAFVQEFWALCVLVFFIGTISVGKALVYGRYLHNAPVRDRALLISFDQAAFWGLAAVGTFAMGAMVDSLGLESTVVLSCGLMAAAVLLLVVRGSILKIPGIE